MPADAFIASSSFGTTMPIWSILPSRVLSRRDLVNCGISAALGPVGSLGTAAQQSRYNTDVAMLCSHARLRVAALPATRLLYDFFMRLLPWLLLAHCRVPVRGGRPHLDATLR